MTTPFSKLAPGGRSPAQIEPAPAMHRSSAPPPTSPGVSSESGFEALPVAHGATTLEGKRGVPLHLRWWRPESGSPKGLLVISHGLKSHGGRYDAVARELVARGWAVYAHDHRGHGQSGGVRVHVESFGDYVDDLETVLRTIQRDQPEAPTVLFGHSMGGQIALRFALDRQPRLAGLVLAAPALEVPASAATVIQAAGARSLAWWGNAVGWPRADLWRVFALDEQDFSRDAAVVASMRQDPAIFGSGTARLATELLGSIESTDKRAGELRVPLLGVHGGQDQVTSPEATERFIRRATNTSAVFQRFPSHVHDLLHDLDAQEPRQFLYEHIDGWLEAAG